MDIRTHIQTRLKKHELAIATAGYHAHEALSCSRFLACGEPGDGELYWAPQAFRAPAIVPSEAMQLGTLLHAAYYEPDSFCDLYAVRPVKNGRLVACDTQEYREWATHHEGKIHVHPDDLASILRQRATLQALHDAPAYRVHFASDVLSTETSYIVDLLDEGWTVRVKPDRIRYDGRRIIIEDLKRSDPSPKEFLRSCRTHQYFRRADFYIRAMNAMVEESIPCVYRFIVVDDSGVAVYQAGDRCLDDAHEKNSLAFARLREHVDADDFRPLWQTGVYIL